MAAFPHVVAATELRAGMRTFTAIETPDGQVKLKPDVTLSKPWADTPGFVHHHRWPHLSWKCSDGRVVVYSPCASVWVA